MTLHQAGDTAVDLPRVARRPLALLSGGLAAFLLILSTRYGPHRDELYFRTAGQQLAWGYVDQPASTPLVAGLVSELFGDALAGWRLPSALAAGVIVLLTGLLARRFGGDRPAQLLAAAAMAVAAGWLRRRSGARGWVVGGLGLSFLVNAVLMLPVLPVRALAVTPIVDINYDAGETVGWPSFVATVADVYAARHRWTCRAGGVR